MKPVAFIAFAVAVTLPGTAMAMPNPASTFCKTMGGQSVMAKLGNGDSIGLCYLPGKKIVEEWTLFRMFDGRKPAPRTNPFR